MNFYIGIDNGGTATKAAIYDDTGRELAAAAVDTEQLTPGVGFVERDMDGMWSANCQIIREALRRSGLAAREISAVACCGHGKGLYLWGKDGRPVRKGILSADTRAIDYVEAWKRDGTTERAFALSLQNVMACQPVALLAWLRDHEPELIDRIRWIFPCKDYIRFRLTGNAGAELSDMSGTSLVNLRTRTYDKRLLELFGIEFAWEMLPPLCESTQLCGYVNPQAAMECGLAEGTPVYGGMFDINACALAVGAVQSSQLCMIAGTWSINEYVSPEPVCDGSVALNSLFCMGENYLIEESSATSAGNNEWFLKKILRLKPDAEGAPVYEEANRMVEAAPVHPAGPIFLPFVAASNVNPAGMGAFVGLSEADGQGTMVRSVYEGVVFAHRYHLERLLCSRKESVERIRLSGGAARSDCWVQMFADILGYPIESAEINETGAFGCAILLAYASGGAESIEAAVKRMTRFKPVVYPRAAYRAYYNERYRLYLETIQALDGLWADLRKKRDFPGTL